MSKAVGVWGMWSLEIVVYFIVGVGQGRADGQSLYSVA